MAYPSPTPFEDLYLCWFLVGAFPQFFVADGGQQVGKTKTAAAETLIVSGRVILSRFYRRSPYTHVHHAATEQSNGRRRAGGGLVCTHGCAHVPQVTLFKHSGVQLGRCPSLCLKPPGNDIHAVPSLPFFSFFFFLPHKHIFCKLQ